MIWNVVNGVLFAVAVLSHIVRFGKLDFEEGAKLIRQFDDAAMGASILSAIAVALAYTPGLLAHQRGLTYTAFALLFIGLGFRYQIGHIFQQRENDKVAEAMVRYLDEVTNGVKSFTASLLKLPDEKIDLETKTH